MLGIANRTREKTAATICATPPPVIVSCYCRQPMRCVRLCLTAQTHRWLRQRDAALTLAVPPLRGHRPTPLGTVSPLRSMTLATAVVAACVSSTSPVGRQVSLLQGPGLLGSMMPRPSRALAARESVSTNPLAVFLWNEEFASRSLERPCRNFFATAGVAAWLGNAHIGTHINRLKS